MLDRVDLKHIARARVEDAEILFKARRYDGAIYLCGYAVEIALKARICETLGWSGYPSSRSEFANYESFRTHNLDVLLRLSGKEQQIKAELFAEWSAVAQWGPDLRYKPIGSATKEGTRLMVDSSKKLLRVL
jgi:hypothetical protein